MVKAWMRRLEIHLTSTKANSGKSNKISFGVSENVDDDPLEIEVVGYKYMSALQDTCTIKLKNLNYTETVRLIMGEYYDVEIIAGYKNGNANTIFKGAVLYISNVKESLTDSQVTILCGTYLIARYSQSRLNFSFNSGINVYSALNYVAKSAGINNANFSTQFKKQVLEDNLIVDNTVASFVQNLTDTNESYIVNSDTITDSIINLYDANKSNMRVISLTSDNILLVNGYPKLTNDGVNVSVLPTLSFMCGDTVKIDNSLLQLDISSIEDVTKNYGMFFDPNSHYTIFTIVYTLQNRGQSFQYEMQCKARSAISNYIGLGGE